MVKAIKSSLKEIPKEKLLFHERYCIENITLCPKCGEAIVKEEFADHEKEFHTAVKCDFCSKLFEREFLSKHRKKCLKRQEVCVYCDLTLAIEDLHEHEEACGSKTEECLYCFSLVPIKDLELHVKYTCEASDSFKSDKKERKELKSLNSIVEKNKENSLPVSKLPVLNNRSSVSNSNDNNSKDSIVKDKSLCDAKPTNHKCGELIVGKIIDEYISDFEGNTLDNKFKSKPNLKK